MNARQKKKFRKKLLFLKVKYLKEAIKLQEFLEKNYPDLNIDCSYFGGK